MWEFTDRTSLKLASWKDTEGDISLTLFNLIERQRLIQGSIVSAAILIYGLNLGVPGHSSRRMWDQWLRWNGQDLPDPRLSQELKSHFGTIPNHPEIQRRLANPATTSHMSTGILPHREFAFVPPPQGANHMLDFNALEQGQNSHFYEIRYNADNKDLEFTRPGPTMCPVANVHLPADQSATVVFPGIRWWGDPKPVLGELLISSEGGGWYSLILPHTKLPYSLTSDRSPGSSITTDIIDDIFGKSRVTAPLVWVRSSLSGAVA